MHDAPIYDPLAIQLGLHVDGGKSSWFSMALTQEEFSVVERLPIATVEALYPEVASFGPGGFNVMKFKSDWVEKRSVIYSMDSDSTEYETQLGFLLQTAVLGQFDTTPGELIMNTIHLTQQLGGSTLPGAELDVLVIMLRWIVVDGFLSNLEQLPPDFTASLGEYRALFAEMSEFVGLDGGDYLGFRR